MKEGSGLACKEGYEGRLIQGSPFKGLNLAGGSAARVGSLSFGRADLKNKAIYVCTCTTCWGVVLDLLWVIRED